MFLIQVAVKGMLRRAAEHLVFDLYNIRNVVHSRAFPAVLPIGRTASCGIAASAAEIYRAAFAVVASLCSVQ